MPQTLQEITKSYSWFTTVLTHVLWNQKDEIFIIQFIYTPYAVDFKLAYIILVFLTYNYGFVTIEKC